MSVSPSPRLSHRRMSEQSDEGRQRPHSPRSPRSRRRRSSQESIEYMVQAVSILVHGQSEVTEAQLTALLQIEDNELFLQQALPLLEDNIKIKRSKAGKLSRSGATNLTTVSIYLSPAHDWVCWVPSNSLSNAFTVLFRGEHRLELSHIVRVCAGQNTTNFTRRKSKIKLKQVENEVNRSFSAVTHDRSLDLVMKNQETRDVWVRTLTLLCAKRKVDNLEGDPLQRYFKMQWNRADTDRSGSLNLNEVRSLLKKMNVMVSKQWVASKIKEHDENRDELMDYPEFEKFMKKLAGERQELFRIIKWIQRDAAPRRPRALRSQGSHDELLASAEDQRRRAQRTEHCLSLEQLMHFLNKVQCARLEARWEEAQVLELIQKHDKRLSARYLAPIQFAMLLDDPSNSVFDPRCRQLGCGESVEQYMSQPLSHYWINSSHNTYLTGDQLQGHSTSDQYSFVLEQGCRCVELDCWDGSPGVPEGNKGDEPIITHGHTLCTKIFFRDAIKAIHTSAFSNNPYPIVLSIEMHCSNDFQKKMWEICEEILGDNLLKLPDNYKNSRLPSPETESEEDEELDSDSAPSDFDEESTASAQSLSPVSRSLSRSFSRTVSRSALSHGPTRMFSRMPSVQGVLENAGIARAPSSAESAKARFRGSLNLSGKLSDSMHMSAKKGRFNESFSMKLKDLGADKDERAMRKILRRIEKKERSEHHDDEEEESSRGRKSYGGPSRAPSHPQQKTAKFNEQWSKLVYLAAVHFKALDHPGEPYEMSSFAEAKARKLAEHNREGFVQYNERQISRIYPHGGRVDSSNLDPIPAWAAGCQMVALNFQTGDCPIWLNFGKFQQNGATGYVLKPPHMRGAGPKMLPCQLIINVLSCQRLPNNSASSDIVDVYVVVEVHGMQGDAQIGKTKTVQDNGFNPTFMPEDEDEDEPLGDIGESFVFEIHDREVAMLKFMVMDENVGQDDMIGQCCIPVTAIRPGIRHVPLYDTYNGLLHHAGVLCRFSVGYIP